MHSFCLLTSMELILFQTVARCICILMIRTIGKLFLKKYIAINKCYRYCYRYNCYRYNCYRYNCYRYNCYRYCYRYNCYKNPQINSVCNWLIGKGASNWLGRHGCSLVSTGQSNIAHVSSFCLFC